MIPKEPLRTAQWLAEAERLVSEALSAARLAALGPSAKGTYEEARAALLSHLRTLAQAVAPKDEPVAWSQADAIRVAHAAGFAGESWSMGPEELAHLLTVARPVVQEEVTSGVQTEGGSNAAQ